MTSEASVEVRPFDSTTLDELEPQQETEQRSRLEIRRRFGIGAFGTNAYRAYEAGATLIAEHDELGPSAGGHEELYAIVSGHATFTVDGNEIDAPTGTLVFVRDPAAKRKAVAEEAGTTVLCIGGKPGEAFRVSLWEEMAVMWEPYRAKDYERAIEALEGVLERYPGNEGILYNLACCEALAGRREAALEHLEASFAHEPYRSYARTDTDFDPIRDDPRFVELVGEGD
jgi:tetratricopeptide (TPR) repeat protein